MTIEYLKSKDGNSVHPFYLKANGYDYNLPVNNPDGQDCFLPLEIDTEYKILDYETSAPHQLITDILTVQIRSISISEGIIYAHPQSYTNRRHKRFYTQCAIADYLIDLGYNVEIYRGQSCSKTSTLPFLQLDLHAFFAIVDIIKLFTGGFREDIVNLVLNNAGNGIKMERRLRATTKFKGRVSDFCYLPWVWVINGKQYAIRLSIKDTSAVHGNSSYASFCRNSKIILPYKDTFSSEEKSRMDEMCKNRPVEFDNYALGDLHNHDALMGNATIFREVYKVLNLEEGFVNPNLTTGSTVSKLLMAFLNYKCGHMPINDKGLINGLCKPSSVEGLEHLKVSTGGLCLKVDGGRCRNNRPTDIVISGALCDLDISGAYNESMREQIYPMGVPVVIDYNPKSGYNQYMTLRQFMKSNQHELVPGLWILRVSLKESYRLTNPQDIFASWKPPKDLYNLVTDTDNLEDDAWWENEDNVGVTRVLNYEITNAALTHDTYQWIMNEASPSQRKELLDNLEVRAAMFHPKSEQVNNIDDLIDAHKNWGGKNRTSVRKIKGKTTKIKVEQECHKWYGIPLRELLDVLAKERKNHPKKTPENELYKLVINTIYGIEVSPFFAISNVVVGNNITARVRVLAWCMEKGLNGFQSITDGCAFDMNQVLTTISKGGRIIPLSSTKLTNIKKMVSGSYAAYTSLHLDSCYNKIQLLNDGSLMFTGNGCERILSPDESFEWVNKASMIHLQSLFSGLDVLHKETVDIYGNKRIGLFEFEAKDFYSKGTFHGSANYMLENEKGKQVKYRSYPKKPVHKIDYVSTEKGNILERVNRDYYPVQEFLERLENPTNVPRSNAFLQQRILKVSEYRNNIDKWGKSQVVWGDTIDRARLLKEFSPTQFTYQTFAQLEAWLREYSQLIRKCGQSYEMFYLNPDKTLNYQQMILDIQKKIERGDMGFFDGVNRRVEHTYRDYAKHPAKDCLEDLKAMLCRRYKFTSNDIGSDEMKAIVTDHGNLVGED